jgi:predicted 2-oxoglutarate/Fe(II)-dependent dioxygenase YbiX
MPGTHAGILWISGDKDCGGDLGVMDTDGEITKITFEKGKLIIFPIDYLHKVEHYDGTQPRVSINITYE